MNKVRSVLFVCTGNSCRSVMAEGLLKKYLKEFKKDYIEVRSAGIGTLNGMMPTDGTIEVMAGEGIDVSKYTSKKLTDDLIKNSDLILVMEYMHKDAVAKRAPEAASKTYLVKEFGVDEEIDRPEGFSIPDPIGRPMKDYEYCFNTIKKEIERIAKLL